MRLTRRVQLYSLRPIIEATSRRIERQHLIAHVLGIAVSLASPSLSHRSRPFQRPFSPLDNPTYASHFSVTLRVDQLSRVDLDDHLSSELQRLPQWTIPPRRSKRCSSPPQHLGARSWQLAQDDELAYKCCVAGDGRPVGIIGRDGDFFGSGGQRRVGCSRNEGSRSRPSHLFTSLQAEEEVRRFWRTRREGDRVEGVGRLDRGSA